MVNIGKQINRGVGFIPPVYSPSENDVAFVGAMGILGAMTVCGTFFGAIEIAAYAMLSHQSKNPVSKKYYSNSLALMSGMVLINGIAQLSLGLFVIRNIGNGPLDAPVAVAMFVVHFPEISISVGLVWIVNGIIGILHSSGNGRNENSSFFQVTTFFLLPICVHLDPYGDCPNRICSWKHV